VKPQLDLITIGRVSVDLYGQQIGGRLEDVTTFAKAVGGCPANIAIGAARLGLSCALISRVGDEPMGHFVREQLRREGVATEGLKVDGARLTALVLLAVRDQQNFPLIFYRDNCADSALCEADVDEAFVASARALLLTGTHFSLPGAAAAQRKAMRIARANHARVILDLDYRPNLWGIGGHGAGDSRYARSARVTAALAPVLADCDLIVGTEEELHVAAGVEDTLAALRQLRAHSEAVIVCKRGAQGCVVFAGPIPDSIEGALVVGGEAIEVYNVLGAGDAFLAGYLSGYLRDAPHAVSARRGNACGAIAVSRLLCSSEYPTQPELEHYLARGSPQRALRADHWLSHLHRATTRRPAPAELNVLPVDYRHLKAPAARLAQLARLTVAAAARVAGGGADTGVMLGADNLDGASVQAAAAQGLWLARAVEAEHARPLDFAGSPSVATELIEWPAFITVACRCDFDPAERSAQQAARERELQRLAAACRAQGRELLLDLNSTPAATERALDAIYALGIYPDWWRLPAQATTVAWEACTAGIIRHDPFCRGVLLGLDTPAAQLVQAAAVVSLVRGIAMGRAILTPAAQAWLSGQLSDTALVDALTEVFKVFTSMWSSARSGLSTRRTPL
jgi:5-dehydro-2-deoxygluconokinase